MKVYFVRHGQSQGNLESVHQNGEVPLSINGRAQAKEVAQRFSNIKIDAIIASDYKRAHDTASEIAKITGHQVETNKLLREIKIPTELEGLKYTNQLSVEVRKQILEHLDSPGWKYSDEERFEEIVGRAEKFIKELEHRSEETILCVAHGEIIRNIIMLMILGDEYNSKIYITNKKHMYLENTSITICEFDGDEEEWKLITWGDSTHL